ESSALRTLAGEAVGKEAARGKVMVMHLGASEEACLTQATSAGASELVVGMSADGQPAGH
ncbi:MAG: hypothetical protein ACXWLR_13210, partial [Myxococcales bacterium]